MVSINNFQLKLISELPEMFTLLIKLLVLTISDAIVFYAFKNFCFVTCFYLHVWSSPMQRIIHNIFWITYSRICRRNLLWLFAARICCRNLPWKFISAICHGFFVCSSKSFLACVSKSCLYGSKRFLHVSKICEIFFMNSVSFCYCRGSHGPPYTM